jgi:uncharacterized membrane protein YhaH (DUF805 family)
LRKKEDQVVGWLFFSFRGRINRAKYWLAGLTYFGVLVVLAIVLAVGFALETRRIFVFSVFGLIAVIAYAVIIVSSLAVGAKRLHDRDKSAWWILIFYVLPTAISAAGDVAEGAAHDETVSLPFNLVSLGIGIWAFVELGCLRGTIGPNRFGADPLPSPDYPPNQSYPPPPPPPPQSQSDAPYQAPPQR